VMVFQDYALFPHLSAAENIVYGLRIGKRPEEEIRSKLARIASYLSIEGLLAQSPAQLSGGQQQRVALARALVMEPEVLLLDEPLSNLDARLRVSIRAELRRMQKNLGITTIYVTHDQTEALAMSDQVVVMNKGEVVQVGTPREIYFAPRNPFVASFVGMANLLEARVVALPPGGAVFDADGLRICTRCRRTDLEPGMTALLSIRPEHIRLTAASDTRPSTGREAAPGSDGTSLDSSAQIRGTVLTSLFEGAYVRYWVAVGKREIVVDDFRAEEDNDIRGPVSLTFSAGRVHVMRPENDHA
jgi:iron(III) transport system ATP-binding protein